MENAAIRYGSGKASGASKLTLESFLINPRDVYHIARRIISSEYDVQMHSHDYAEIFWVKEGSGIHVVNGEEHPLRQGSIVMIRPFDSHAFKVSRLRENMVITNIAFFKSSLTYYKERYFPDTRNLFWIEDELPFVAQLSDKQLNELSSLADRLLGLPKDNMHLDHIMLHIFSLFNQAKVTSSQLPHWLAYAIENYVTPKQFRDGLEGFVRLCNRSGDHVNRTLQVHLKQSLSETVNKARLGYAAQQLTISNSPVKSICFDCGFENISYFYRLFKRHYGLTPADYRTNNHGIFQLYPVSTRKPLTV